MLDHCPHVHAAIRSVNKRGRLRKVRARQGDGTRSGCGNGCPSPMRDQFVADGLSHGGTHHIRVPAGL